MQDYNYLKSFDLYGHLYGNQKNFIIDQLEEKIKIRDLMVFTGVYSNALRSFTEKLPPLLKSHLLVVMPEALFSSGRHATSVHPKHEIAIARKIAKSVNNGEKYILATHSDFILRELNTLIMFSYNQKRGEKIQKKYGYEANEILKPEQVIGYEIEVNKSKNDQIELEPKEMEFTPNLGLICKSIDDVIIRQNHLHDCLRYGIEDDE